MTLEEFNKKWDFEAYNELMNTKENWIEEYKKYLEDCYSMYETEGFCDTFESPYTDYKKYNGQKFKVVCRMDDVFMDLESLPAWLIKFEDGDEISAWPEEICSCERTKYVKE